MTLPSHTTTFPAIPCPHCKRGHIIGEWVPALVVRYRGNPRVPRAINGFAVGCEGIIVRVLIHPGGPTQCFVRWRIARAAALELAMSPCELQSLDRFERNAMQDALARERRAAKRRRNRANRRARLAQQQ